MRKTTVPCDHCHNGYEKLIKNVNYNKKYNYKNFCCKSCLIASRYTSIEVACYKCGKAVTKAISHASRSKSGYYYCSKSCSVSINNALYKSGDKHPNYNGGLASYRKRALAYYGPKCAFCDYSVKKVLQVHHKDKNRDNNDLSNLIVLCPTHHREIHVGVIVN